MLSARKRSSSAPVGLPCAKKRKTGDTPEATKTSVPEDAADVSAADDDDTSTSAADDAVPEATEKAVPWYPVEIPDPLTTCFTMIMQKDDMWKHMLFSMSPMLTEAWGTYPDAREPMDDAFKHNKAILEFLDDSDEYSQDLAVERWLNAYVAVDFVTRRAYYMTWTEYLEYMASEEPADAGEPANKGCHGEGRELPAPVDRARYIDNVEFPFTDYKETTVTRRGLIRIEKDGNNTFFMTFRN